jgi:phi13 family phage major tail protein
MSKKIGLKYPVCAKYDDSTGTPVYTDGMVMGKAMTANLAWTSNNVPLYADDALDDIDQSISGGTEALGLNELTHEVQAFVLGHQINGNGEMVVNENDLAPYLGHGFYGKVKRNGAYKYRAIWLYKMQYSEPADDNTTKGETVAFQTPTINGTIMKDVNGNLKIEKLLDVEADAIAWLNAKAGIPVSSSSGLTGLTMAGTGGTLSPAFGANTRYYTFGGLTGTSFTVTATAANHTIQLYINDVLTQTLTSGVASSAIAIAATGTKKLKIVAFEAGKQSQTTEIVVVKVS